MNSLVDYGVSSDSDGEVDDVNSGKADVVEDFGDKEAAAVKKSRNFLLESGSASSESEPDDDQDPPSSPPHPQTPSASYQPILPAPSLDSLNPTKLPSPSLSTCSDSSVFANPFKAQADQRLSALQKHVPLTMQAKPSQIGGKRICVSYRKDGRCRFGIKCKFAHDSDLQIPVAPSDCHPPVSEETPEAAQAVGSQNLQQDSKEEASEGQPVKKRRVGLSNTLIPPKRALKQYTTQRDRERISMS
ncbi:uncharacterized protein si:ch211-113e8.11 [Melanotaenia boesemani]|uniref:uncharacterized protein si:ch211-113e8.11 n=1 Tax=Melanotaenia boesemani TaxID=1250792 RepID=UPI001C057E63|nr:uncharacterized protein si:ch211-113e8.11 [Melanotaenia boesemani]